MTQRPCDQRVPVSTPHSQLTHVRVRTGQPRTRGGGCSHTEWAPRRDHPSPGTPPGGPHPGVSQLSRSVWPLQAPEGAVGGGLQIPAPSPAPRNLLQSSYDPVSAGDYSAVTRGWEVTKGGYKLPHGELGLRPAESGQCPRPLAKHFTARPEGHLAPRHGAPQPPGGGGGAGAPPILPRPRPRPEMWGAPRPRRQEQHSEATVG